MRDANKTLVCPECNGDGIVQRTLPSTHPHSRDRGDMCYYCAGTGYATDDDTEERFYK